MEDGTLGKKGARMARLVAQLLEGTVTKETKEGGSLACYKLGVWEKLFKEDFLPDVDQRAKRMGSMPARPSMTSAT